MSDHSPIGPSSAGVWCKCPASVQMSQKHPRVGDEIEAEEGTLSHAFGESCMLGLAPPGGTTPEMEDCARVWVDDMAATSVGATESGVEERVAAGIIHSVSFGTIDGWAWFQERKHLIVTDYKYGHGYVDEFENYQCIMYLAGLFDRFREAESFEVRIVQPRCFGHPAVRVWKGLISELLPLWQVLQDSANNALSAHPDFRAGSHCKHCTARHCCPAQRDATTWAFDKAYRTEETSANPVLMAAELRELRLASDMIGHRLKGLEAQVEFLIKSGEVVGPWMMKSVSSRTCWTLGPDRVVAIGLTCGVDLAKTGAITPNQAITAGLPKEMVALLSEKRQGSPKLVELTEKEIRKTFR